MKTFSAVRGGEYKYYFAATTDDDGDAVNPGGASGVTVQYSYGKCFNLYLDPKETHSYFIRRLVYTDLFLKAWTDHLATFQKYPPKHPIAE
jgi:hypothetical protein